MKKNVKEEANPNTKVAKTKPKKKKRKKSFFNEYLRWPFVVLILSMCLSFSFSFFSEYALRGSGLFTAILVILVFLIISIITDIVGVAITATSLEPFRAMSARKVGGAKEAIVLIKNADKVASIFADICGDICGILSGAAGAVVTAIFLEGITSTLETVLIASGVSAVIASLIIFGKSLGKKFAIQNCDAIVLILGKFVKFFTFNRVGAKKKKNKNIWL